MSVICDSIHPKKCKASKKGSCYGWFKNFLKRKVWAWALSLICDTIILEKYKASKKGSSYGCIKNLSKRKVDGHDKLSKRAGLF